MDGTLREMEQMKKRKGRKDGAEHPSTTESGGGRKTRQRMRRGSQGEKEKLGEGEIPEAKS